MRAGRTPPPAGRRAAGELDALQPVVLDDEPRHRALDDADAAGCQELALVRRELGRVREEDDVGGPLPDQQRVLDRLGVPPRTPSGWSRTS